MSEAKVPAVRTTGPAAAPDHLQPRPPQGLHGIEHRRRALEIFAQPGVAPALLRGSDLLAQLLFTPLLAGWSIWVGIAISTRATEVRVAQQLGLVANLPSVLVTTLIAFNAIHPSLAIAIAGALLLLVLNRLGWSMTSAMFDRERLITGTR